MIRANLLPRARTTVRAAGIALDADHLRQAFVGLAVVALIALLGIGIGELRLHRIELAAAHAEAAIGALSRDRAASKRLALDVAHYQEFAREAQHYRHSGAEIAVTIARIGNGLPDAAWLDELSHSQAGYELTGGARAVGVVGDAIARLGRALPATDASLVSLENRNADGIHFDAHLVQAAP